MKVSILSVVSFLTSLCTVVVADVELNPFPALVDLGARYYLSWNATANYVSAQRLRRETLLVVTLISYCQRADRVRLTRSGWSLRPPLTMNINGNK